jgi:hypothetical protein
MNLGRITYCLVYPYGNLTEIIGNTGFARPSLAVIYIFPTFVPVTHGIRLPGETFSGA